MPTLRLSAIALILANFVPVFGVLYWGWSVGSIIALYWAENWVIGALNLPKMWMAKEGSRKSSFPLSLFFADRSKADVSTLWTYCCSAYCYSGRRHIGPINGIAHAGPAGVDWHQNGYRYACASQIPQDVKYGHRAGRRLINVAIVAAGWRSFTLAVTRTMRIGSPLYPPIWHWFDCGHRGYLSFLAFI